MSQPRVLKRPPQGWANHNPNYALPDMVAFVLVLLGGALCFNWLAACIDAIIGK